MSRGVGGERILAGLGAEITCIAAPVSACMLAVMALVRGLTPGGEEGGGGGQMGPSIGALVYKEDSSDSDVQKFGGAALNALVFIAAISVVTFVLVGCFWLRCTRLISSYMAFSGFTILAWLGGSVAVQIIQAFSIPIDVFTFGIILYNFSVVGVLSVFFCRVPILVTQSYLVIIGAVVAFWFTHLPEWTTWLLLVAMALYDLAAVLLPGGPLKLLVEMAIERDEEIPALIYEARPNLSRNNQYGITHQSEHSNLGSSPSSPPLGGRPGRRSRNRGGGGGGGGGRGGGGRGHPGRRGTGGEGTQPISSNLDNSETGSLLSEEAKRGSGGSPSSSSSNGRDPVKGRETRGRGSTGKVSGGGRREGDSLLDDERRPLVAPYEQNLNSNQSSSDNLGDGERESGRERGSAVVFDMSDAVTERVVTERVVTERVVTERTGNARSNSRSVEDRDFGFPDSIKLGLGDFIFYSVLIGRAAMYDLMTVYSCYLAIIAGLGATLMLLAVYRKALPALPISIALGVVFYLLTRLIMDPFIVDLATRLVLL